MGREPGHVSETSSIFTSKLTLSYEWKCKRNYQGTHQQLFDIHPLHWVLHGNNHRISYPKDRKNQFEWCMSPFRGYPELHVWTHPSKRVLIWVLISVQTECNLNIVFIAIDFNGFQFISDKRFAMEGNDTFTTVLFVSYAVSIHSWHLLDNYYTEPRK